MLAYSKDGTKPPIAVEREIEIYRETLTKSPRRLRRMTWRT